MEISLGVIGMSSTRLLSLAPWRVKNDDLDPPIPELNQQLAEFIATQLAEVVR
jgi:hypothetical protein